MASKVHRMCMSWFLPKGCFFAESFFAYNYVLAKPGGTVRWVCGAREVVCFFFSPNPLNFSCVSEGES